MDTYSALIPSLWRIGLQRMLNSDPWPRRIETLSRYRDDVQPFLISGTMPGSAHKSALSTVHSDAILSVDLVMGRGPSVILTSEDNLRRLHLTFSQLRFGLHFQLLSF